MFGSPLTNTGAAGRATARSRVHRARHGPRWNIWALTVATGVARPLVAGDYDDIEPQFSPDRRRLAFTSNRSGRWAVYVQDLQAPGTEPRMVSAGLANDPRWSPSGDTLYFLSGDRRLLAVPAVGPDGLPILGAPRRCSAQRRSARSASACASTTPSTLTGGAC